MIRGNELNELSTSEWIHFTKTIWETNYPLDLTWPDRKICRWTKQPQVMRDVICFFTQGGDTVLDPFANVGSTLIGAAMCGRPSMGIEKEKEYIQTFNEMRKKYSVYHGQVVKDDEGEVGFNLLKNAKLFHEDAKRYLEALKYGSADFVLTSPPFGPNNLEHLEDYVRDFKRVGRQVYRILETGKYFCFFMGDRFHNGKYIPLAHRLAVEMEDVGFKLKGMRVWVNKAKPVSTKSYGVGQAFVPNIEHENLIICCKEK